MQIDDEKDGHHWSGGRFNLAVEHNELLAQDGIFGD
jgi:hypothetical protein